MIGADNITRRSEGPLAGCATATAKIFGSRSLAGRWGRSPTQVALGNADGRLPGGKPDEGEPHVRFGKGEQETGFATAPAPHFTRWALLKNPGDLTDKQAETLAGLRKSGGALWRAYQLKEALRAVFAGDLTA